MVFLDLDGLKRLYKKYILSLKKEIKILSDKVDSYEELPTTAVIANVNEVKEYLENERR